MSLLNTHCCGFQADQLPYAVPSPVSVEREEKPIQYQPVIQYDTYDDFERIYMTRPLEISLRMSVGAKKQGIQYIILYSYSMYLSTRLGKSEVGGQIKLSSKRY